MNKKIEYKLPLTMYSEDSAKRLEGILDKLESSLINQGLHLVSEERCDEEKTSIARLKLLGVTRTYSKSDVKVIVYRNILGVGERHNISHLGFIEVTGQEPMAQGIAELAEKELNFYLYPDILYRR